MKQAFPCVLVLLAGMLAGCEVSTQPAPAPLMRCRYPKGHNQVDSVASAVAVRSPRFPQVARGHLQFIDGYAQGLQLD